ncbi:MAG: hypothetical protein B6U78_01580, partial [Candidatus Aenigmarchaeota archaeon ex4484_224]
VYDAKEDILHVYTISGEEKWSTEVGDLHIFDVIEKKEKDANFHRASAGLVGEISIGVNMNAIKGIRSWNEFEEIYKTIKDILVSKYGEKPNLLDKFLKPIIESKYKGVLRARWKEIIQGENILNALERLKERSVIRDIGEFITELYEEMTGQSI